MEKINIAELLKDCPRGMELYSPIFGKVYLDKIRPHLAIVVTTDKKQGDFKEEFLYDGRYGMNGECMLFPSKDKTTWEGFQRPFKDGDVISNGEYIAIFHKFDKPTFCSYDKVVYYHCWYDTKDKGSKFEEDFGIGRDTDFRFATIEEKQILFDVIKANGYKWNSETKTLEKVSKYPTSYEECCKVLDFCGDYCLTTYDAGCMDKREVYEILQQVNSLTQLLICRSAYWKIAGEEMSLDKPWNSKYGCEKWGYWIGYDINSNKIYCPDSRLLLNRLLVFPTKEMRDTFFENFKDLIEQCKGLL